MSGVYAGGTISGELGKGEYEVLLESDSTDLEDELEILRKKKKDIEDRLEEETDPEIIEELEEELEILDDIIEEKEKEIEDEIERKPTMWTMGTGNLLHNFATLYGMINPFGNALSVGFRCWIDFTFDERVAFMERIQVINNRVWKIEIKLKTETDPGVIEALETEMAMLVAEKDVLQNNLEEHSVSSMQSIESGNRQQPYEANITDLASNTEYCMYAVGTNAAGAAMGGIVLFTTKHAPPIVVTLAATDVVEESATLNGTIDMQGSECSQIGFRWHDGDDPDVITFVATEDVLDFELEGAQSFSVGLTLVHDTEYFFEAYGVNSDGLAVAGDLLTFTTSHW